MVLPFSLLSRFKNLLSSRLSLFVLRRCGARVGEYRGNVASSEMFEFIRVVSEYDVRRESQIALSKIARRIELYSGAAANAKCRGGRRRASLFLPLSVT